MTGWRSGSRQVPETLELTVRRTFAARMRIPDHAGECSRYHGYRFELDVTVRATVDRERPWITDVLDLERIIDRHVTDHLDNGDLGQVVSYPSLEGVLLWIVDRLRGEVPELAEVVLTTPPEYQVRWSAPGPAETSAGQSTVQ